MKRDSIHYSVRAIRGYQKPFNFIMSARELAKTTSVWLDWIYYPWKKTKKPWIYLVRNSVEITDALINSIFDSILNKFKEDGEEDVTPQYTKGNFKEGIVDVKIKGEPFIRIVSLSIPLRRIKLAVLKNCGGAFMDEYIIDPRTGEKYIQNEAFKIKEAYTTWRREVEGVMQFVFAGNPYSLYNPLFLDWKVDVSRLKRDSFYVGADFVIHWASLSPELREHLLQVNPLYRFDEDYAGYALEGQAINDRNIKIGTLPSNYSLAFVFRISGKLLGVFRNQYWEDGEDRFFCTILEGASKYRDVFVFDIDEMIGRSVIISNDERVRFRRFKTAFRKNSVSYADINSFYLIKELYLAI